LFADGSVKPVAVSVCRCVFVCTVVLSSGLNLW
jgi:hypothetical protein